MIDNIPLEILQDRTVSVLEAIVEFLKNKGLSFHEIGILLNRDERNMWTIHSRALKKRLNISDKIYPKKQKSLLNNTKDKLNISDDKSVNIYGVTNNDRL